MSGRRCTACKRLCLGHHGPTGAICTLKSLSEAEVLEDINADHLEAQKLDFAEGTSSSDSKLDHITAELEKLVTIVGSLSGRVRANESKILSVDKDQSSRVWEEGHPGVVIRSSQLLQPPPIPPRTPAQFSRGASVAGASVPSVTRGSGPTTQSLARDNELSRLLDQYNQDESPGELLRVQDQVNTRLGAQGELKLKKSLQIPDFITSCDGIGDEEEDFELLATKGRSFKLQGQKKKPEAKDVTVAQWISANFVILELLTPTLSPAEIVEYYSYSRKIGDFLQIYSSSYVFMLDAEHRKDVTRGNRRWDEISQHHVHFYLTRLRGSGASVGSGVAASSSDSASASKKKKSRFNHPCTRFNTREGCHNDKCKFQPCCNISGCRGSHPAYDHPQSDNFRKGKSGSEGIA
jgi:hypothetical protein